MKENVANILNSFRTYSLSSHFSMTENLISEWNVIPWHFVNDPMTQFDAMPSYLIFELCSYFVVALICWHASCHKKCSLIQVLVMVVASIELICSLFEVLSITSHLIQNNSNNTVLWQFKYHQVFNNFYHAQALIMLTPRVPLCIFSLALIVFYPAIAVVSDLSIPNIIYRSALCALLTLLIATPLMILASSFLWITWHSTEPLFAVRLLGMYWTPHGDRIDSFFFFKSDSN
jgi:hypothetical protein